MRVRDGLIVSCLALSAAACTATGQTPPAEVAGSCDAQEAQFAVGERYSDDLGQEARDAAGANAMRKIEPGQVVTMEFRGDRLNLVVDQRGRVSEVRCG